VTEPSDSSTETPEQRNLRYLAPNLITLTGLLFGVTSIAAAHHQNFALAGWMIIYAVLFDRLDGMVARRLRATSDLGMQLDSLADFLNFGLAPPFLLYCYLCARPDLPFDSGWERPYLLAACALWTLAAAFRLARFNIQSDDTAPTKVFFGVPTTLAGGTVTIWFLAFLKYSRVGDTFGGGKVFGDWTTPRGIWLWTPLVLALGGLLMASSVRIPKVGKMASRFWTVFVLAMALFGYFGGFLRLWPELMAIQPTVWLIVFLVLGQFSERLKSLTPPPLFPRRPSAS
jgi:CDP-diacylglycerol--serine O-phosphatidyltransferase